MKILGVATVTERGIQFQANYYSCPEAISRKWFEQARAESKWEVFVAYNTSDLSKILIFSVPDNEWIIANIIIINDVSNAKLQRYFRSIQKLKRRRYNPTNSMLKKNN
ncbi:Mu transposase C-terminal domain-containing protein [Paenibacillus radicis (ex Xue et al. 2023)]|uniref:Mu transposase C-terminal domain-containing protein n=1 Tax=Paenibacillus radicis (ex Xue et al. 2023) TaxID=2972489 RepID=A0ABT1YLR5_9BACL|nr:Mu transposase C-terminal domain-containing protein [Paenibacillus radicis (ex Xue et al. 2023)]MCR8633208.1 Mu transposase C-terminal domain-containing protein [Paenibacillus radicis (ex Xue et al. 2023)]